MPLRPRTSRLLLVSLLVFGPLPARAHYPHDAAFWLAISPDPDAPRLATSLERIELDLLGRSENGRDWAARLVQPVADGPTLTGAFLTSDRLLLGTERRGLLRSDDAGDRFTPVGAVAESRVVAVAASPGVLDDGVAFAAGEGAVWRTRDAGESWQAVLDADGDAFVDLGVSPEFVSDGRVCALAGGSLACSADGGDTWARTRIPEGVSRLSVGAEDRVWTVARFGGLHLSPDGGRSWFQNDDLGAEGGAIAELSGGLVLFTTATRAAWRSDDGGQTWTFVDVLHIGNRQTGDASEFFDFFEGPDGAVYLTCWNGVARSVDRGRSFTFLTTERPENMHSVALTLAGEGSIQAWLGTYGSGAVLTDLRTLEASTFSGLPVRYTRSSVATPAWGRDGTAVHDEGYSTWRTTDGGASWTAIVDDPRVEGKVLLEADVKGVALSPSPVDDPFLLTTVGDRSMRFFVSEDLGDTWVEGAQEPACAGAGIAVALSPGWPGRSRAWAACGGAVYLSTDRGRSWSVAGDTGASFVFRIVEAADGSALAATSDGLWRVDGAAAHRLGFEGAAVVSVAAGPDLADPAVFALVPTRGWFRSDDGGSSWVRLDAPTADVPRMVALSPRFAHDGVVAVGGYGGAWASADRGETWTSIHVIDLYEETDDAWRVDGPWPSVEWPGASAGAAGSTERVGAVRTIEFRGIAAALEVPEDAPEAVVLVTLDDRAPEEVTLGPGKRVAWTADDLADGWHRLELVAVAGPVSVDALRVTRLDPGRGLLVEDATLPDGPGADTGGVAPVEGSGGCGCGGGERSALGAVAAALWLAGRRRTAGGERAARGRGPG